MRWVLCCQCVCVRVCAYMCAAGGYMWPVCVRGGYNKPTFNLPNKSYYSAGVKGNDIALGLTNGTTNYGLMKQLAGNIGILQGATGYFGVNVGDNVSVGATPTNGQALGITTDSSKSGIVVEPDTQLKLIIKY